MPRPVARSRAAARIVVLPIPADPSTSSTEPPPEDALASNPSTAASSSSRSTSGSALNGCSATGRL